MNNRIVFVITSMGRGGAERVISILANHYANLSYNVHIVMLWHNIVEYELDDRITIHNLSRADLSPYINLPRIYLNLRNLIKTIQPKAVISFIAQNNCICYLSCLGLPVKLILSERIDPALDNRNWILRKTIEYSYAHSDVVVFQTRRARDYFGSKVINNSVIISNPVSVECTAIHNTLQAHSIVTVGRIEPQKNQEMLIRAFKRVLGYYPNCELNIYGDGSLRKRLENLCDELNISNYVRFKGNVKDLHQQMKLADIFVLPSNFEGQSNALLEAMMMGIPCISTNCAGSDEIIINGETGLIIPIKDENALLNAIIRFIEDPLLSKKCGEEGQRIAVKKCGTENVLREWDKVILEDRIGG